MLKHYANALWNETFPRVLFMLGLMSTMVTFLPAVGVPTPKPESIRTIGLSAMLISFLQANYRIFSKQYAQLELFCAENQNLKSAGGEQDVDTIRSLLLELWKDERPGIALNVGAASLMQKLGWETDKFNAASFKAVGDFGGFEIRFDGRNFTIDRIPR